MPSKLIAALMFLAMMRVIAQTVITLAGGNSSGTTSGSTNGVGTAALFNLPNGVAVDTSGNVIVADRANHKVRILYPNRTVITLAGGNSSGTTFGSTNGVGTAALFNNPFGVAVDTSGNVIVADQSNHKIRLIYPNRTVITLAGGSTTGATLGSINGVGTAALFNGPSAVAVDTSGNVIVTDRNNHKVRIIYPNRTVITLAGGSSSGTTSGSVNGVGTAALFNLPYGVAVDISGNVILADHSNQKVRIIYPNRTVITLAGGSTSGITAGSINGVGTAALFSNPYGVSVDTSGNVIVADYSNHKVRIIYPNRTVTTLVGGSSVGTTSGSTNGVGTAALFAFPSAVAVDTSGNVIVADLSNHKIRLIFAAPCAPGSFATWGSAGGGVRALPRGQLLPRAVRCAERLPRGHWQRAARRRGGVRLRPLPSRVLLPRRLAAAALRLPRPVRAAGPRRRRFKQCEHVERGRSCGQWFQRATGRGGHGRGLQPARGHFCGRRWQPPACGRVRFLQAA
jgi:ATP-dependent protease HslVU (ClpYQ) peptidase subunit